MIGATKKVLVGAGVIIAVIIILHIALFAVINIKGRDFILGGIKNNLGLEATMKSLALKLPFNLEIKDFDCEALSFKRANISLRFFNPFTRRLTINKVYLNGLNVDATKYEFKIKEKTALSLAKVEPDDSSISPGLKQEVIKQKKEKKLTVVGEEKSKKKKFSFAVGSLHIEDSRLDITYFVNKCPLRVVFDDITLKVKSFTYPKLSRFYLTLDTVLSPSPQASEVANTLAVKGWIDYSNKNMDVAINVDNLDYFAFSKCYPPFWRPHNLKLKEAVLSLESKLNAKDNDLTIDNFLTLEKLSFLEEEGEDEEPFKVKTLKTIISYLKGDKDKPTLRFKLITTMDSPELNFSSLKENLKGVIQISPLTIIEGIADEVKGKIKETGDTTTGGVVETIKDAADIIKGMFKIQEGE